jgi:hypothetical protein
VHPLDGGGIEGPDRREVDGEPTGQPHGVRPAVLRLLVIEARVGAGGQDLVGQDRRLDKVAALHPHLAGLEPGEQGLQAVDVERLVERGSNIKSAFLPFSGV